LVIAVASRLGLARARSISVSPGSTVPALALFTICSCGTPTAGAFAITAQLGGVDGAAQSAGAETVAHATFAIEVTPAIPTFDGDLFSRALDVRMPCRSLSGERAHVARIEHARISKVASDLVGSLGRVTLGSAHDVVTDSFSRRVDAAPAPGDAQDSLWFFGENVSGCPTIQQGIWRIQPERCIPVAPIRLAREQLDQRGRFWPRQAIVVKLESGVTVGASVPHSEDMLLLAATCRRRLSIGYARP
jgi:hypothetical protein